MTANQLSLLHWAKQKINEKNRKIKIKTDQPVLCTYFGTRCGAWGKMPQDV